MHVSSISSYMRPRTSTRIVLRWRNFSTDSVSSISASLIHHSHLNIPRAVQIWGSNTHVGKTVLSAALATYSPYPHVCYLKPVQTGYPNDDDASFVSRTAHAVWKRIKSSSTHVKHSINAESMFKYKLPASPHIAAESSLNNNIPPPTDQAIIENIYSFLNRTKTHSHVHQSHMDDVDSFCILETAGGVLSPTPTGSFSSDLYRPLALPAILVGGDELGGITTTLSSLEALLLRGYHVPFVVIFSQDNRENALAIKRHPYFNEPSVSWFMPGQDDNEPSGLQAAHAHVYGGFQPRVIELPPLPPEDVVLSDGYLRQNSHSAQAIIDLSKLIKTYLEATSANIVDMHRKASETLWWPFTQHGSQKKPVFIDSASGDHLMLYNFDRNDDSESSNTSLSSEPRAESAFDASASWWTQTVGHGNVKLALAGAFALGRYGHVLFPGCAHEPAVRLSGLLLSGVGKNWASRVFFSDDGSTAIEVALKMAFRLTNHRRNIPPQTPQLIVGLHGSYHGDTLGAMDCSPPTDFNKFQFPWYKDRGLFFDPPVIAMKNGSWTVTLPFENSPSDIPFRLTFDHRDEIFFLNRDSSSLYQVYKKHISEKLDSFDQEQNGILGALLIEPVIQGVGGMRFIDPAFQRALITECRNRQIPVVFDEVFSGLFRLGVESCKEYLHANPDVAAYAKTLTGGTVPMSVTLATEEIFEVFKGNTLSKALLHGHSYTAHPTGCSIALAVLKEVPQLKRYDPNTNRFTDFWNVERAREWSLYPKVHGVTVLGTVLAVELTGDSNGYFATGAQNFVKKLRVAGIFARPLGNVVYLMCSLNSEEGVCDRLMDIMEENLKRL